MKHTLLFLAVRLSMIGTLVVATILCLARFGKWKKDVSYRSMLWFSVAGATIPVLLYPIWIYTDGHLLRFISPMEDLALVLWPASLGLMALEGGTIATQLFVTMILILVNAGLYGLIGLCIGLAWKNLSSVQLAV